MRTKKGDKEKERGFSVGYNEETNEVVLTHYYTVEEDGFDAIVEHALSLNENRRLISVLLEILAIQENTVLHEKREEKSTIHLIEKNPLQGGDNNVSMEKKESN